MLISQRKGHIPTALLPLIALVLAGTVFFYFLTAKEDLGQTRNDFESFGTTLNLYVQVGERTLDKFALETAFELGGKNFEQLVVEKAEERSDASFNNLYEQIRKGEYSVNIIGGDYLITVRNVTTHIVVGRNEAFISKDFSTRVNSEDLQ